MIYRHVQQSFLYINIYPLIYATSYQFIYINWWGIAYVLTPLSEEDIIIIIIISLPLLPYLANSLTLEHAL